MPDSLDDLFDPPAKRSPRERVHSIASRIGVSPDIAEDYLRLTRVESGHNVNVRDSSKGAQGFGQVMPDRPGGSTRTVSGRRFNLRNPEENIEAGIRYFAEGGSDPVGRRLYYFGGPGARARYQQTGRIPNISDGNMTATQYVRATGGQTKSQQQGILDDLFDTPTQSRQPSEVPAVRAPQRPRELRVDTAPVVPAKTAGPKSQFNVSPEMLRKALDRGIKPAVPVPQPKNLRQVEEEGNRALNDTGAGRLRQLTEPETQRINRIQREVTAAQTPAERQLQRAPGTQSARLLDPKLTEHEEVLRRLVAEQDEEKRAAEARAESQRLMAQFTDAERAEITDFVSHLQGKGSIYTGARTGLRRAGSSALYKLAGLAEAANPLLAKSTGIPDYLRKKALAGEISLEDIPAEQRNQIAEFLAETGVGLAELAAMPGGVATKFATLSGSEALGRNRPAKEVIGETAKGAAMGGIQKWGEGLASPTSSYARRLAVSAPAVGIGSGALELATGATPREALMSTVTNAAFQSLGEIGRGRRAQESRNISGEDIPRITQAGAEAIPERLIAPTDATGNIQPDRETLGTRTGNQGDQVNAPPIETKPPNRASVKMFITRADEAALKARGYTQADINRMKPAEAQRILENNETIETKPNIPAQPETVESVRSTGPPTDTSAIRPTDSDAGVLGREDATSQPERATVPTETELQPRRWLHADFGEVVESPNQRRVGKGRVRVVLDNGRETVIKRSDGSGRGNQRAIPLKESTSESVTDPVAESAPRVPSIASPTVLDQSFNSYGSETHPVIAALKQSKYQDQFLKELGAGAKALENTGGTATFQAANGDIVKIRAAYHEPATYGEWSTGGFVVEREPAKSPVSSEPNPVTQLSAPTLESGLERRSPTRMPQTDWLAMSDAERAQIRREIDLEQQNPVAPKPAQVGILTPREGEQLRPPLRQSVTGTVTETKPPESATSARKSQLAQDRAESSEKPLISAKDASMRADRERLGLPPLEQVAPETSQQWLDEAATRNTVNPRAPDVLVEQALAGDKNFTDVETMQVNLRAVEVNNRIEELNKEIADATDVARIKELSAEQDVLLNEYDRISRADDLAGAEWSRVGTARQRAIKDDFSLAPMVAKIKKDYAKKGESAPPELIEEVKQLRTKIVKAEAERDAANERAAQAQLQKEIDKVAKRGTRRQQRTVTKQSLDTEFADLKAQFAKARAEISGVQPSGLAALDPEGKLTKIIAQMARNRVKAGVTDAAQLVDDVFAAVSDSVEGLTKRDVRDAISGYGFQRGDKRSPEAKQLAAIRAELQSLSKTEDIASGQRSPQQEGPQRDYRKDQQRRKQLEKQEADLIRRMAQGDFSKQERVPPTYTRETYAKQKAVDQLKADFEKMRYRATRSTGGKLIDTAIGMANVPKTFLSMGDLSALLRQGGIGFFQHPVLSARATKDMLKSFSEHGFANVENAIKNSPEFELAKRSGVEFTGIDRNDPHLNRREEGYLGSSAIDTLAKGRLNPLRAVKAVKDVSERTFVSFLDSQRMRIFEQQAQALRDMGLTGKDFDAAIKSQAGYINKITGRGSLGERGNQYAPALNLAMFSPRLVASRFQLLNKMLNPVAWARTPKGARKLQLVDNAKFLVGTATVLGLAKAAGADVNLDPEDSEFLKIKIGNTRYDTLTGLQQPMRFMLRLSSAIKADITGDETYAGGDKGDIVADFLRSKASPELGLGVDYLAGGNRLSGEKFSLGKNLREAVTPLPVQEFMDAAKTDGKLRGTIETLPTLLGVGAQTYKSGEKPTTHAEKLARKFMRAKLPDEARDTEEIELDTKKSELRARARQGENVQAELRALDSKITKRQAANILAARRKERLQEDVNKLGIKEALLVYSVANAEQRADLKSIMHKKKALADVLPSDQRQIVKKQLREFGF